MASQMLSIPEISQARSGINETLEQRLMRLGRQGVTAGVKILTEASSLDLFATSSSNPDRVYRVDVNARICACVGFEKTGACMHLGLALLERNIIDDLFKTCPDCHGDGGWKAQTGDYFSDWVWATCRRCDGIGTVRM